MAIPDIRPYDNGKTVRIRYDIVCKNRREARWTGYVDDIEWAVQNSKSYEFKDHDELDDGANCFGAPVGLPYPTEDRWAIYGS